MRIAVAEQIAYIVQSRLKLDSADYDAARDAERIDDVIERWNVPVIVMGDFNDEPHDRSVVDHLRASSEEDRVAGGTNDVDGFEKETAKYRGTEIFLYNPMWRFLHEENDGTYFIASTRSGETFPNRYQVLDQLVVSRGLLGSGGLTLDGETVAIFRPSKYATKSGRPKRFKINKNDPAKSTGASDHFPIMAGIDIG